MKRILLLTLMTTLFTGCSEYTPDFNRNFISVLNDLKSISEFEDAKIGYSKRNFNSSENFLVVTLMNGKNLPENEIELKKIGKKAMKFVFDNIENETIYDNYEVVFYNEKGNFIKKSFRKVFNYNFDEIK